MKKADPADALRAIEEAARQLFCLVHKKRAELGVALGDERFEFTETHRSVYERVRRASEEIAAPYSMTREYREIELRKVFGKSLQPTFDQKMEIALVLSEWVLEDLARMLWEEEEGGNRDA